MILQLPSIQGMLSALFNSPIKNTNMKRPIPPLEQIEGNVIIAKATGWVYKDDQLELFPNGYWSKGEDKDWSLPEDLKFHSDWNWISQAYSTLGIAYMSTDITKAWNELIYDIKFGTVNNTTN